MKNAITVIEENRFPHEGENFIYFIDGVMYSQSLHKTRKDALDAARKKLNELIKRKTA